MNAAALIARAAAEGVILDLTAGGTLKATGATTTVDRWLPVIRQHKDAILAALKVRRLVPDLADELIAFWEDDVADILQLPDEALRRLAEDYRRHRDYNCAATPRRHARRNVGCHPQPSHWGSRYEACVRDSAGPGFAADRMS